MGKPQHSAADRGGTPARRRKDRKSAPAKSSPASVGEVFGISAFASGLGVSGDFALALTCSVLTGIAGPEALVQAPWGASRLPKLDVLVEQSLAASRFIDCLSAPLERLDRRLSQNMSVAHSEAVEYLAHGVFANDTSKKGRVEVGDATLRRNLDLLIPSPAGLHADLTFDPVAQRVEAVLHPRMLVRKCIGRDLPGLVAECHRRTALVIEPSLGLDREGSEPSLVTRDLVLLLDGTINRNNSRSGDHPRNDFEPARAQAILSLGPQERETLMGAASPLLDRLLWLSGDEASRSSPLKPDDAATFYDAYQSACEEIVELRRAGHSLMASFESAEAGGRFHEVLRSYEMEVGAMTSSPGPSVIRLPESLYCGMYFLRRALRGGDTISDESLITYAFESARRLAGIHNAQVLKLRNAGLVNDRVLVALRVVEKLQQDKVPMKFRDLARLFSRQNKERFIPVLDLLVEAQVLIKSDLGFYELGPADFDEVADLLGAKIAGAGGAGVDS